MVSIAEQHRLAGCDRTTIVLLIALVFSHTVLNLLVAMSFAAMSIPVPLIAFIFICFVTLPLSFEVAELFLCLAYPVCDLPRLEQLTFYPKVALLYVTCDDFELEAFQSIVTQSCPNYDTFVLDDSEKYPISLTRSHNFTIVIENRVQGGSLNIDKITVN